MALNRSDKRVLLLFDVDGTLLLTGGAGMRAMDIVGKQMFGEHFTWEGIMAGGSLDPMLFAEAAAVNGLADADQHHDRFRDAYLTQLQKELADNGERTQIMPGIETLITQLRDRALASGDVELGLLTGNYTDATPIKLAAIGIDPAWFSLTVFGDEAQTRPDMVELAMQKYHRRYGQSIAPEDVIVIGDTPRDVHCAHAHDCVSFAVATGKHPPDELRRCGADVVVDDLSDASVLLDLIDQKLSR